MDLINQVVQTPEGEGIVIGGPWFTYGGYDYWRVRLADGRERLWWPNGQAN